MTTKDEWERLLKNRGSCLPSQLRIVIRNGDSQERSARVGDVLTGRIVFPTKEEREKTMASISVKGNLDTTENEEEAISHLALMLSDRAIEMIPCSKHGIEHSSADALISTTTSNQFIGVQVTRVTMEKPEGAVTINKSKQDMITMLQKGFIFCVCIFVENEFHAAALWLPEDIASFLDPILDDDNFLKFNVCPFGNRIIKGSRASQIFYPSLYMFPEKEKAFISRIEEFVTNNDITYVYTLEQVKIQCIDISNIIICNKFFDS